MKKLIVLLIAAGAGARAARKRRAARSEADLWREATSTDGR